MRAAVFYATKEGQTKRIAERIASDVRDSGFDADVYNVKQVKTLALSDWSRYDAAFVAASVHAGHHEPEMIAFVKRHHRELERLDAAFISVTLSQAGAEDPAAPPERQQQARADAEREIDVFV